MPAYGENTLNATQPESRVALPSAAIARWTLDGDCGSVSTSIPLSVLGRDLGRTLSASNCAARLFTMRPLEVCAEPSRRVKVRTLLLGFSTDTSERLLADLPSQTESLGVCHGSPTRSGRTLPPLLLKPVQSASWVLTSKKTSTSGGAPCFSLDGSKTAIAFGIFSTSSASVSSWQHSHPSIARFGLLGGEPRRSPVAAALI
mmetsp:Transcript_69565/g.201576  ORF Transcript_69565/g.201576 Transcript_69565/m.201576 type:complete len:202 (+) Transcript_69565:213-818(+)